MNDIVKWIALPLIAAAVSWGATTATLNVKVDEMVRRVAKLEEFQKSHLELVALKERVAWMFDTINREMKSNEKTHDAMWTSMRRIRSGEGMERHFLMAPDEMSLPDVAPEEAVTLEAVP